MLELLRPLLVELAQLFEALGPHLEEPRWTDAAKVLEEMIEVLKRPSAFFEMIRARDAEADANRINALELLRKLVPRKGQAMVRLRRRA